MLHIHSYHSFLLQNGWTALLFAVDCGQLAVIKLLTEKGANLCQKELVRRMRICLASFYVKSCYYAVECLSIRSHSVFASWSFESLSPALWNSYHICHSLSLSLPHPLSFPLTNWLIDSLSLWQCLYLTVSPPTQDHGMTPLLLSVSRGYLTISAFLVSCGADMEISDKVNFVALSSADFFHTLWNVSTTQEAYPSLSRLLSLLRTIHIGQSAFLIPQIPRLWLYHLSHIKERSDSAPTSCLQGRS